MTKQSPTLPIQPVSRQATSPLVWQDFMKSAIRSRAVLLGELGLNPANGPPFFREVPRGEEQFPIFVPRPFLQRIVPGDWNDPLLRQVLPLAFEDHASPDYVPDPLGETEATRQPGLLQKYQGRALIIANTVCAIHCRYCFRRHYPYDQVPHGEKAWEQLIAQIAADASLHEIILSGGDPLLLVDNQLAYWFDKLEQIPHLKTIRIHTRMPIMIPTRITNQLGQLVERSTRSVIVVIHANHAQEIDGEVAAALGRLRMAGAMLLNQAVLLAGINDELETLIDLSKRLIECGTLPYYLHKNDPIEGTSHFEVPIERGITLIEQMRARLPGYAVPRFVQELAGETSKRVLR